MTMDRRMALKGSACLIAAGAMPLVPALAAEEVPANLAFISKASQLSRAEFIQWYEALHAPAFVSFAAPHLSRYARNFVLSAQKPVDFDVISEFIFKSRADQAEAMRLRETPAGNGLREGPGAMRHGIALVRGMQVQERLVAGPPRTRETGVKKTALLLKRTSAASAEAAAGDAVSLANSLAEQFGSRAGRVALISATPGQADTLFDDVIMMWPHQDMAGVIDRLTIGAGIEIANILELEYHESDLAQAKAKA